MLVDTAKTWARIFGPAKGSVIREAIVARLVLERRLGQLLDVSVNHTGGGDRKSKAKIGVIADDSDLPEWISRNVSSAAQTLALCAAVRHLPQLPGARGQFLRDADFGQS
jgi:hypothetical protein